MKLIASIGRFISGIIALVSGIFTLIFNDISFLLYDSMPTYIRYICIVLIVILGLFLIITSVIDFIMSLKSQLNQHSLKYQSKKYFKYFSNWYSKSGKLSIICDDLDWVSDDKNNSIYNVLKIKSQNSQLSLYLGKGINSNLAKEFESCGAKIFKAPEFIIGNYTWSCLSVMGNTASRVIVRNKQNDKNGVVIFEEITNKYVTGLLNELLDGGIKNAIRP